MKIKRFKEVKHDELYYWSIDFQDPYMIYKISKMFDKKYLDSFIEYKSNHPRETRLLYLRPQNLGIPTNSFNPKEFEDFGYIYAGDIKLTDEEKELADLDIQANKYNL